LVQVLAPALKGLVADHGASVAFHRGVVCGDELRRDHALDLQLLELERLESALLERAAGDGLSILPRADMDPKALLGVQLVNAIPAEAA
jgi:hypothetical protein